MRQYILPKTFKGEDSLVLRGKESQYLSKVLRLKEGQHILGRDQTGKTYQLTIEKIGKQECRLSCIAVDEDASVQTTDALPSYTGPYPNLTLMQCLCKGKKEEQIVRQATEIGVREIVLVQSRYCIPDLSGKSEKALGNRFERLDRQVKEALQQSGSPLSTEIHPEIIPLTELSKWWENRGPALFFHQSNRNESQKTLHELLESLPIDTPIALLVGPEGGFNEEECSALEDEGWNPVLLRTNILRSETAGIYALSAIQTIMTEKVTEPVHLSKRE